MTARKARRGVYLALLVPVALMAGDVRADTAQHRFYKAYYAEQADRDWTLAAQLYEQVVKDREADSELRTRAEARLASCREELAVGDFARLMPPDAWAYVELKRPGDQVVKLLDMLGLSSESDKVPTPGQRRVAVSPSLVREVLGIGGAAVAITGFDMVNQIPHGVLVFHPGDLDILRGMLETGLPVGGNPVEPIGGYATYSIENKTLVTLTSKLVIVSPHRSQIEGVIGRLNGTKTGSMATNPALADAVKDRDDSLLLFFVNAKAMMPVIRPMLLAGTLASREMAMAQTVLDIDSFNSLAGSLGVNKDGLFLDLALRLDEGHHNLVFNFFRTPAINPDMLKCVPDGAAAVLVGALNSAGSRYSSNASGATGQAPPVTALDFGREVFANITSFVLFALPPDGSVPTSGPPIPDVAAVMTVNDPAMSQALWTQMLGLASLASGAPVIEGPSEMIDGVKLRSYKFPDGITVHFATSGNDILIGTSKTAVTGSIRARKTGRSILDDRAFAPNLARLTTDSTKALWIHAGRCATIAKPFMSECDLAEAAPVLAMLADTSASIIENYSGEVFRTSTMVTGIPDVGDFVSQMVTAELQKEEGGKHARQAPKTGKGDEALAAIDAKLRDQPGNLELLEAKFELLATGKKDREAALAFAESVYERVKDDADALNNMAWGLLTEKKFGDAFGDLALRLSRRSNELTNHANWMYVDTLALATFKTGDAREAVKLERKAIELCGNCGGLADMNKAVARFESRIHD